MKYSNLLKGDSYWSTYMGILNKRITSDESMESAFADELCDLGDGLLEGFYKLIKNENKAIRVYKKAAEKGNWKAAQRLSQYLAKKNAGAPIGKDSELFKAFEIGANAGESQSAYNLAVAYGLLGEQYAEQAAKYYRISAEGGNPDGACRLARAYACGFGVQENLDIAAYWMLCRMHGASASTMAELSQIAEFLCSKLDYLHVDDNGTVSSKKDLIQLAMDGGERTAFSHKAHITQDKSEKLKYAKKAASMGHAEGFLFCAELSSTEEEKMKNLKKAAELGDPYAQFTLGESLMNTDSSQALFWLNKVILHGPKNDIIQIVNKAYYLLALIYLNNNNSERALYCWKFVEGKVDNKNNINWEEVGNSVFESYDRQGLLPQKPITTGNPKSSAKSNQSSSSGGGSGCMVFLIAIISIAGALAILL